MKLPKHKYLLTYRYAEVVHDLTEEFCRQFLPGRENLRLREQMRSAARSNKQNIVEGVNQQTPLKGQIKLLGVAQASTETTSSYPPKVLKLLKELRKGPEEAGNLMLTLTHQLSFLLTRQIRAAEKKFIEKGGWSENLFRKRISFRRA